MFAKEDMPDVIATFGANLKRAIAQRGTMTVGGGVFTYDELLEIQRLIYRAENYEDALTEISEDYADHMAGRTAQKALKHSADKR